MSYNITNRLLMKVVLIVAVYFVVWPTGCCSVNQEVNLDLDRLCSGQMIHVLPAYVRRACDSYSEVNPDEGNRRPMTDPTRYGKRTFDLLRSLYEPGTEDARQPN
ncbi:uncharacterized protein [Amphiura filiformis]|uniref:uncharacterized protein n=1 Tax=Amphiura filiformis TaxID=82378 RepID=UPI003B20F9F2